MSRWTPGLIIFVVAAILVIVFSPYVDLPYTTVRSKSTANLFCLAIFLAAVLVLAQVAYGPGSSKGHYLVSYSDSPFAAEDLVRLTCAYLC